MHTTTILICFFIFLVQVSTMDAHTDKYVRTLCGKTAIRNIANLCPPKPEMKGICSTGGEINLNSKALFANNYFSKFSEYPSITEYCSMGFSDSQIKFMCCDNQWMELLKFNTLHYFSMNHIKIKIVHVLLL